MQNDLSTYYHSIVFQSERCLGDMACMKVCPVGAIRVRNGKAKMIEDRCIDCGECVKVCIPQSIVPLTNTFQDFSNYKYTVVIPALALYSQFDRNVKPKTILSALEKIGFDEACDVSKACISVTKALSRHIKENKGIKPLIATFCPTCVKIIQVRYPELLNRLVPIIPPIELAAKDARKEVTKRLNLKPEEVGVIYITPCPSKMILISQKTDKYYSDIDGAIPITEIYNTLYNAIYKIKTEKNTETEYFDVSGFGLNFDRIGGLGYMMENENNISISGINNVLYILDEIDKGKLHNVDFVEMHSCAESCLGGPMVVENAYLAGTNLKSLIDSFGETKIPVGKKDPYSEYNLYNERMFDNVTGNAADLDIKNALSRLAEKKKIYAKLPKINCGACGSPDCEAFAEDCAKGETTIFDCVVLENKKLKKEINDIKSKDSKEQ